MSRNQADDGLATSGVNEYFFDRVTNGYVSGSLKRTLDLGIALSLVVFLLPAFTVIAVAIKFGSPGPVFFRQDRHGAGKRPFTCLKFRTMTVCEGAEDFVQCQPCDVRVTAIGRLLRRTSLDELPQFFNVIMGSMSIVGPRPHAISHDEQFGPKVLGYDQRFLVKPGITGLAQVNGLRGPTDTVEIMARRIDADRRYVRDASLLVDLKIMLLTVPAVLGAKNAF